MWNACGVLNPISRSILWPCTIFCIYAIEIGQLIGKSNSNVSEYLEVNYYSHSWLSLNSEKKTITSKSRDFLNIDSFLFIRYSTFEMFVFIWRNLLLVESFTSAFVWPKSIPLCWSEEAPKIRFSFKSNDEFKRIRFFFFAFVDKFKHLVRCFRLY